MTELTNIFRLMLMGWLLLVTGFIQSAQAQFFDIRSGNQAYEEEKFSEAQEHYSKVLNSEEKIKAKKEALFNKGNAAYRQENYSEAQQAFEQLAVNTDLENSLRSEAFYNTGNAIAKQAENITNPGEKLPKLEQALDQYKQALKLNPGDVQAKQNFELVSNQINALKKQQQNQDQENKQEEKKEEKKQEQKEEQKQQQEQQQQEQKQEKTEENKPQPKPNNFSKEQAERILNALKQDEKQMLKKYQQKPSSSVKFEKDW